MGIEVYLERNGYPEYENKFIDAMNILGDRGCAEALRVLAGQYHQGMRGPVLEAIEEEGCARWSRG